MKISIIGTGYVGTGTAISFANWGHQVVGVDTNTDKIAMLQSGELPFYEDDMEKALQNALHSGSLSFTANLKDAVDNCNVLFVTVGTPSAKDGSADLSYIESVCSEIGLLLPSYKVIVLKSTVPVGTCKRMVQIISAKIHERGVDVPFDLVSNPEFLREGQALADALHPERIVVGCESLRARAVMEQLYEGQSQHILMTSPNNAEMIKYASNAFLATKISFINELARLCDKTSTDIVEVAHGMGLDSRIGPHFLHAGIGYGGSCFPKDVKALLHLGQTHDTPLSIQNAVSTVNRTQASWFIDKLTRRLGNLEDKQISLLGLSFKPNTDDIRMAPSLKIIQLLLQERAMLSAYDPKATIHVQKLYPGIRYTKSSYDAVQGADAIVLITEWPEIIDMDWQQVRSLVAQPYLFDGRNVLDPQLMCDLGFYYTGVGRSPTKVKDREH